MFIAYGSRNALGSNRDVFMYECPFCEKMNTTTIFAYSRYFHIFWIPVYPYAKNAVAKCNECGAKRDELKFGPKLVEEYKALKKEFKHPWWTYSMSAFIVLLILLLFIKQFL